MTEVFSIEFAPADPLYSKFCACLRQATLLKVEPIFEQGQGVIIIASGSGKLHLLTYDPSPSKQSLRSTIGFIEVAGKSSTTSTRLMISHSYGFQKVAFYWEGVGQAVATAGPVKRAPVGANWGEATCVELGDDNFTTRDVSKYASSADQTDVVTCFFIPELA